MDVAEGMVGATRTAAENEGGRRKSGRTTRGLVRCMRRRRGSGLASSSVVVSIARIPRVRRSSLAARRWYPLARRLEDLKLIFFKARPRSEHVCGEEEVSVVARSARSHSCYPESKQTHCEFLRSFPLETRYLQPSARAERPPLNADVVLTTKTILPIDPAALNPHRGLEE